MDRQAEAFRLATPADWRAVADLAPIPDTTEWRSPEWYEARGWDDTRLDPKTPLEARAALAARAANPAAPDDDASAYDDLIAEVYGGRPPRTLGPLTAGGLYVPWYADAARWAGLPVTVVPGQETRGHGGMRALEIVTGHHTGTPDSAAGDYPSRNVVTNGRAGLAGPLCNLGLGRTGMVYVVAAGCAWHAGASAFAGFTDLNDEAVGIEAEDNGDGKWSPAMLRAYPRLVAGLLHYMRRGVDRYCSHRTCAVPAGRKPDPAGISDAWMRAEASAVLASSAPTPAPAPKPTPAPSTNRGGTVIPVQLPRTDPPAEGVETKDWPWREEVINLGFVGGWRGRCMVRISFGHPGGRIRRAHFDTPNGKVAEVKPWPGLPDEPGAFFNPSYKAVWEIGTEAPAGPTSLMISYAAPGGASLSLEWEK